MNPQLSTDTRPQGVGSLSLVIVTILVLLTVGFSALPTNHRTLFAEVIIHPWSVRGMVLVMVLSALWTYLWFRKKVGSFGVGLSALWKEFEGSEGDYLSNAIEKVGEDSERFGLLGECFRSYISQLVGPARFGDPAYYRTTIHAGTFFYPEHLFGRGLNLSLIHAIPNYFTGAGIIFTFVGLAAGIYLGSSGFESQNMTELRQALSRLLSGASLAFFTSIVGLSLSIVLSVSIKSPLHEVSDQLRSFAEFLDKKIPFVSQEQLAQEQLDEAKEQTGQLKTFNTDLAVSVAGALDKALAPRFEALGSSISGALKEVSEKETEGLERVIQAVEGIRTDQGESLIGMMEQLIGKFQKNLSGATGAQFNALGEALKQLTETTKASQDEMRRSQEEMAGAVNAMGSQAMEALQAVSRTLLESVEDALQKMTEVMKKGSKNACKEFEESQSRASAGLEDAIAKAVGQLKNSVDYTLDRLSTSLNSFNSGVEAIDQWFWKQQSLQEKTQDFLAQATGLTNQLEKMSAQLKEIVQPLGTTAGILHRTVVYVKQGAELTNQSLQSVKELSGALERHRETLTNNWEQYELRFRGLDESLASVFRQIEGGLSSFATQLTHHVAKIDEHTSGIAGHLNTAASALDERTEDFVEAVERLAGLFEQVRR